MPRHGSSLFKIMQLADLHMGEDADQDNRSMTTMAALLDKEKPDLVVFSGDQLTGESIASLDIRRKLLYNMTRPLVARGIPWASIFGNHDACDEAGCPDSSTITLSRAALTDSASSSTGGLAGASTGIRDELLSEEQLSNFSYTGADGLFRSSLGGRTNYYLKVYNSATDASLDQPSFLLWFVDTGGGDGVPQEVPQDVVDWMVRTSADLTAKYGMLPGLLYAHIPLQEYKYAYQSNSEQCTGIANDVVSQLQKGPHLFSKLSQMHIDWVFAGHDHGSDWCCRLESTTLSSKAIGGKRTSHTSLCYGRHTGDGGYRAASVHKSGARLFEMNPLQARKFLIGQSSECGCRSWVRLADGSAGPYWSELP